jgi:hypothetical protein
MSRLLLHCIQARKVSRYTSDCDNSYRGWMIWADGGGSKPRRPYTLSRGSLHCAYIASGEKIVVGVRFVKPIARKHRVLKIHERSWGIPTGNHSDLHQNIARRGWRHVMISVPHRTNAEMFVNCISCLIHNRSDHGRSSNRYMAYQI